MMFYDATNKAGLGSKSKSKFMRKNFFGLLLHSTLFSLRFLMKMKMISPGVESLQALILLPYFHQIVSIFGYFSIFMKNVPGMAITSIQFAFNLAGSLNWRKRIVSSNRRCRNEFSALFVHHKLDAIFSSSNRESNFHRPNWCYAMSHRRNQKY